MERPLLVPLLFLAAVLLASPSRILAQDGKYDLVLRNGKIVDGTGNPWYYADLAITGDKIAALGTITGKGKREIDAKGLIVSPGFIDMHSHSDFTILEDGKAMSKITQGVTTEVLGESSSPGPYQGKLSPPNTSIKGKMVQWSTLGGYFDTIEKAGVATNIASFVGLGTIWRNVMGDSHARPTKEQFKKMKSLVEEAMRNGAAGLSCMTAAPPDSLATTDEIVELCKIVKRYGGIFATHIRNEGTEVFAAIKEAIEIGRRAGITVEIIHIKIADQKHWGRMNEVVKLIDDARKEGVNVGANVYPYTRGNNNLASILPPWAHEGGTAAMLNRLKDPIERAKIKKDVQNGIPGWYNHYTAVGGDWARMLIAANNSYKGLTMDRVLRERTNKLDADLLEAFFDFLIEEGGSVSTVYDHHTEKDMTLAMQQPWCSIGSDGYAMAIDGPTRRGHPHPRSFGTFPRVLGVYVRQKGLLKLEDAVRKMTSQNATKIGVQDRGLLRPGLYADIAIFDADKVLDRATYTEPFQYSVGIEYVIVNGQVVLDRGKHTGLTPGRALRMMSLTNSKSSAASRPTSPSAIARSRFIASSCWKTPGPTASSTRSTAEPRANGAGASSTDSGSSMARPPVCSALPRWPTSRYDNPVESTQTTVVVQRPAEPCASRTPPACAEAARRRPCNANRSTRWASAAAVSSVRVNHSRKRESMEVRVSAMSSTVS